MWRAPITRSRVRTRVARIDWWASRSVVSLTSRAVWARIQAAKPAGPSSGQPLAGCRRGGSSAGRAPSLSVGSMVRAGSGTVGPVDGDVAQPPQQPGGPVGGDDALGELGPLVDEAGGHAAGGEVGVGQHGLEEADVGGEAPDPELGQGPPGPAHGGVEALAPAGELGEQRVEVGGDLGPLVAAARVEPHAGAAGIAVGQDAAGVGPEAVGRVFGGDAALEGGAPLADAILGEAELGQRAAGGDLDLGAHDVDVGGLLGDRVLHLDPGFISMNTNRPSGSRRNSTVPALT